MGPGLRFKSRIFRICLYLRKDTRGGGYTCLSEHFFLFLHCLSRLICLNMEDMIRNCYCIFQLSKFLHNQEKTGIITVKELSKGISSIVDVDRSHEE